MMTNLNKRKLMTVAEVRNEYILMDIRKLRAFLNENISFIKIGERYFYHRQEVDKLFNDTEKNYQFKVGTY